jgi:hypothetical protein
MAPMAEQVPGTPVPTSAAVTQLPALRTDGMAIAALVVGLIAPMAAMFDGVPGVIMGSVAVFLGLRSRRRIKRSGGMLQGGGMALAGWIVGLGAIVLGVVIAVFVISLFLAMQSGTGKGGAPTP